MHEHQMSPEHFWKLRTRLSEHQRIVERCRLETAQSQARLDAAMTEAGLDVRQRYRLIEETCSAVPDAPVALAPVGSHGDG